MAQDNIKTHFKDNIPEIIVPTIFSVAAGLCAHAEMQPIMQVVMGTVSALYGLCAIDAVANVLKHDKQEQIQSNYPTL